MGFKEQINSRIYNKLHISSYCEHRGEEDLQNSPFQIAQSSYFIYSYATLEISFIKQIFSRFGAHKSTSPV